ncbi:MAG: DNA repair exonuclease [Chloroflexi bacterium]|nr:DNA repair exonuclease [Chloroflexota bacterium]
MNVFRIVLVADSHLGFDLPEHPRLARRRRGDDFFANYQRVLDHAVLTRPLALVHGGDFFFRSRVAPAIVERAFQALAEVAEAGIDVFVVPGNHDRSRLPPSLWLGHRNIHVFWEPRTVVLNAGGCTVAIGGFPFARGDLRTEFPRLLHGTGVKGVPAAVRLLCMHQAVGGATVGPGDFVFQPGRDVVHPASLPRTLTAVLAGHIHRAQTLEDRGPPVFYPGSIERTSFAERDDPKGYFDLTFAVDEGGRGSVAEAEFITLPTRPMVDVTLPSAIHPDDVGPLLALAARECRPDSVFRVSASDRPSPGVLSMLTAGFLRSCFPATANVQLGRSLFNAVG